jgi:hypothetical protein
MIDAAVAPGIPRDAARLPVAQTALGSAYLVLDSAVHARFIFCKRQNAIATLRCYERLMDCRRCHCLIALGAASLITLAGCGGGGGASATAVNPRVVTTPTASPTTSPIAMSSPTASPPTNTATIGAISLESLGPRNLTLYRPAFPNGASVGSGKSNGVIEDPNNSNVLYSLYGRGHGQIGGAGIANSGGVYKSTDGGQSFSATDTGLADAFVDDLWIDPSNSNVLVVGTWATGIYRSTNAGATWSLTRSTSALQFAYQAGVLYCACSTDGVLASTDAGQTWSVVVTASNGQGFESIGAGKTTVFAATNGVGSEVYRLASGIWSLAYTFSAAQSAAVQEIAVSPLSDSTITIFNGNYPNTMGAGAPAELYLSQDGGNTFNEEPVPEVVYNTWGQAWFWIQAIEYSPTNPTRLYALGQGPLEYSDDFGNTWTSTFDVAQYGSVGDGRGLNLLPNANGGDQCFVSSDQGEMFAPDCTTMMTAQQIFIGVSTSITYGVAVSGNNLFVLMQDYDGIVSQDGGQTWNDITFQPEGGAAADDPYVANQCFAAATGYALYTTTDGCAGMLSANPTFVASAAGIGPSAWPTDWIAFANDGATVWTIGASPGQFYVSHDVGITWHQIPNPPDSLNVPQAIDVDPTNPNHLLAATARFYLDAATIYDSTNGGQSWTPVQGASACFAPLSMDFYPQNTNVDVLACTTGEQINPVGGTGVALYRSGNGGATWTPLRFTPTPTLVANVRRVSAGISERRRVRDSIAARERERPMDAAFPVAPGFEPAFGTQAAAIRFNPSSSTPILAMATTAGLYVSGDAGTTWAQADTATITHCFDGLVWQNGYLYVSSIGQGILRSTSPLQPVTTTTNSARRSHLP